MSQRATAYLKFEEDRPTFDWREFDAIGTSASLMRRRAERPFLFRKVEEDGQFIEWDAVVNAFESDDLFLPYSSNEDECYWFEIRFHGGQSVSRLSLAGEPAHYSKGAYIYFLFIGEVLRRWRPTEIEFEDTCVMKTLFILPPKNTEQGACTQPSVAKAPSGE